MAFAGNQPTRPVSPKLSDLGARKAWLAKQGIDRQLVGDGWICSAMSCRPKRRPIGAVSPMSI